jgi:hypothetical protein
LTFSGLHGVIPQKIVLVLSKYTVAHIPRVWEDEQDSRTEFERPKTTIALGPAYIVLGYWYFKL